MLNGALLNVRSAAKYLGGEEEEHNTEHQKPKTKEKWLRGLLERQLIPHRRISGRIYFIRAELDQWLQTLDGCGLDEARKNLEARHG